MHIKKNLAIAAAVAVLAVPALGATNVNADSSKPSTEIITNYLTHSFDGYPAGTPIYNGHYQGGMNNIPKNDMVGSLGHPGAPDNDIPENDESTHKPIINNQKNTNTQSAKSNTSAKAGSQNGELAQTGESNTGAKAGIVGTIAAMVSVAFAGVEKFFKRA